MPAPHFLDYGKSNLIIFTFAVIIFWAIAKLYDFMISILMSTYKVIHFFYASISAIFMKTYTPKGSSVIHTFFYSIDLISVSNEAIY